MSRRTCRAHGRLPTPRSQRGTMLIIALIVLVAMTLAGIATMRSVDTATIMAGNLAFRQSALNAADQGIQTAFTNLKGLSATTLNVDGAIPGYFSSAATTEPNWTDDAAWVGAVQLAPDAAGNVVSYIIQRMCTKPGVAVSATNQTCGSTVSTARLSKEGEDNFRLAGGEFSSQLQVQYRITARSVGPRRSIAVVQMLSY